MIEIALNSEVLKYLQNGLVVQMVGGTYYLNLHETIAKIGDKYFSITDPKYLPLDVINIYKKYLKKYDNNTSGDNGNKKAKK